MRRNVAAIMFTVSATLTLLTNPTGLEARSDSKEEARLYNSALVMKEAMGMQSRIPQDLLEKAYCVIVIPSVIKGAFGVGASYGRGAMSCRSGEDFKGPWSPPTMMALEGGSAGFQVGGQATDFVLLVMSKRGASSILSGKFKIGGDAAASAGPIGRDTQANLDVYMRTTILTYSRSRGLFAGVSLEGSTLRPDNKANKRLYGKEVSAKSIVLDGAVPTPASADKLISTLNEYGKNPSVKSASGGTAPPPTPNRPPVGSCYADPVQVTSGSGDTVSVRADASDPDNDPLTYTWTATAGTIEGSGSQVRWNPAGAAAGAYPVTVRVDDGRGGSVSCVAEILVAAREPALSCSASPNSVHAGDRVHITASARNPNNNPLSFTWESDGGRIVGSGAEVELDTTGAKPSRYAVTGQVSDGRGGTADCRAEFNVEASPPPVEAKLALRSIYFPTALPTPSKPNVGLVESQQKTLKSLASDFKEYLENHPDAHLILQGHADRRGRPKYNKALSERRAEITRRYLVGLGIPKANLETKALGEEENMTTEQVKQLVEEHPSLSQEKKDKILTNLPMVTQAQNRRVDITLSGTGQQSVRQFPFNAEDALTLLSPTEGGPNLLAERKP